MCDDYMYAKSFKTETTCHLHIYEHSLLEYGSQITFAQHSSFFLRLRTEVVLITFYR